MPHAYWSHEGHLGQKLSDRFWNTMPSQVAVCIAVTRRLASPIRCSKRFLLTNIEAISQRERPSSFMHQFPGRAFPRGFISGNFLTEASIRLSRRGFHEVNR